MLTWVVKNLDFRIDVMRYKLASLFLLTFIFINAYGQSASNLNSSEIIKTEMMTDKDCKYVEFTRMDILPSRKEMSVSWSGDCRDGYLSGLGTLKIALKDGTVQITKVNFTNGIEDGEGEATKTGNTYNESFVGRWQKGLRTYGTQEIKYGDKSFAKYTGEFKDAKYHGFGKFSNSGGTEYEGDFKNGEFSGKGRRTDFSGTYIGDFKNNRPNGVGRFTYKNGEIAEGEFVDDYMSGKGKLISTSGDVDQGNFVKGKLNGIGTRKLTTGETLEGNFINGVPLGVFKKVDINGKKSTVTLVDKHTLTYANGDVYDGEWVSGKASGYGKLTYKNGSIYEGEFKENKFNGKGKITESTGTIQEGIFNDHSLVSGKIIYTNGGIDSGTFVKTKLDGKGLRILQNGDTIKANFVSGIPIGNGLIEYKNGDILSINFDEQGRMNGSGNLVKKNGQKSRVEYDHGNQLVAKDEEKVIVSPVNADDALLNFDDAKKKCIDIGFKAGTEKFGQCVLKLTK